jgi:hypothetical protein
MYSIKKYRYDIQLAWYYLALISEGSSFQKQLNLTNRPAQFIYELVVESTANPGSPAIYQLEYEVIKTAIRGDKYRKIKGIENLIEDLKYYNNHGYGTERILDENEHILQVNMQDLYD